LSRITKALRCVTGKPNPSERKFSRNFIDSVFDTDVRLPKLPFL